MPSSNTFDKVVERVSQESIERSSPLRPVTVGGTDIAPQKEGYSATPISVNTNYELTANNTRKLWLNLEREIKESVTSGVAPQSVYDQSAASSQQLHSYLPLRSSHVSPLRQSQSPRDHHYQNRLNQDRRVEEHRVIISPEDRRH